jgi:hypothetical protein
VVDNASGVSLVLMSLALILTTRVCGFEENSKYAGNQRIEDRRPTRLREAVMFAQGCSSKLVCC